MVLTAFLLCKNCLAFAAFLLTSSSVDRLQSQVRTTGHLKSWQMPGTGQQPALEDSDDDFKYEEVEVIRCSTQELLNADGVIAVKSAGQLRRTLSLAVMTKRMPSARIWTRRCTACRRSLHR